VFCLVVAYAQKRSPTEKKSQLFPMKRSAEGREAKYLNQWDFPENLVRSDNSFIISNEGVSFKIMTKKQRPREESTLKNQKRKPK